MTVNTDTGEVIEYEFVEETALVHQSKSEMVEGFSPAGVVKNMAVLKQLLNDVLEMGIKKDYAKIPGCGDKPVLLLPGAQKLAQCMGLAIKVDVSSSSLPDGHIMFTASSTASHMSTEVFICNGIGIGSTLEGKWSRGNNPADMYNTVAKMAHKRAYVSAVLAASGASAFLTQDIEEPAFQKPSNQKPFQPTQAAAVSVPDDGKLYIKSCGAFGKGVKGSMELSNGVSCSYWMKDRATGTKTSDTIQRCMEGRIPVDVEMSPDPWEGAREGAMVLDAIYEQSVTPTGPPTLPEGIAEEDVPF